MTLKWFPLESWETTFEPGSRLKAQGSAVLGPGPKALVLVVAVRQVSGDGDPTRTVEHLLLVGNKLERMTLSCMVHKLFMTKGKKVET